MIFWMRRFSFAMGNYEKIYRDGNACEVPYLIGAPTHREQKDDVDRKEQSCFLSVSVNS